MARVHHQHHFVAGRDHGAGAGPQRPAAAQHVDHAGGDVGPDLAQLVDGMMRHRAAMPDADGHDADAALGEFDHLQRLGKLDQAVQVGGDAALGADDGVDAEALFAHQFGIFGDFARSDAGDAAWDVEQLAGDLASHHVGRVGGGAGDQQVGIGGARALQHRYLRAVAVDDAQVEMFLQVLQLGRIRIDHRDVVLLGHQVFSHAGAYATSADDQDLHAPRLRADSMPNCLSLRYRWVRSRPVRSETRVMLWLSRTRWYSK